jgi:hypothetical protein
MKTMKTREFIMKDKTGRGFVRTGISETDLLDIFNDEEADISWDGETIPEWLEYCEVGDSWKNSTTEVICIEV